MRGCLPTMVWLQSVATCLRSDNALCVSIKAFDIRFRANVGFGLLIVNRITILSVPASILKSAKFAGGFEWKCDSENIEANWNVTSCLRKGTETAPRLLFSFQRVCWSVNFWEMPSSKSSVFDGSFHILPRPSENKSLWISGPFATFPTAKLSFKGFRASVRNVWRLSCAIKIFRFSDRKED